MERLTHEADVGVEDWEQILYRVPADPEGAYNIFDIAERWVHYDDADCGCILQDITRKLRDYENIAPKVDELYLKKCQEVSELTKRMRWIPVKERLPKKPEENPIYDNKPLEIYLVSVKNTDCVIRAFWNGASFTDGWEKLDVLAWMPLPEPYRPETLRGPGAKAGQDAAEPVFQSAT